MLKHIAILFLLGFSPLHAADVRMRMTTTDGSTAIEFQNAAALAITTLDSAGKLTVSSNLLAGGFISMPEVAAIGQASTDRVRIFNKEISGRDYLAYIDDAGKERIVRPLRDFVMTNNEIRATNLGTTYKDVYYGVSASGLSKIVVNFDGYSEARINFSVDNNQADTIECQIYDETGGTEVTSAISNAAGNPEIISGPWVPINLMGDHIVQARCREGAGATADPDIGPIHFQIR